MGEMQMSWWIWINKKFYLLWMFARCIFLNSLLSFSYLIVQLINFVGVILGGSCNQDIQCAITASQLAICSEKQICECSPETHQAPNDICYVTVGKRFKVFIIKKVKKTCYLIYAKNAFREWGGLLDLVYTSNCAISVGLK